MRVSMNKIERIARYLMAVVAVLALFAGVALRIGWISKAPFYNEAHWYLETSHSSFIVINEFKEEEECRRHEKAFTTCRSGKVLSEEARHRDGSTSL